MTLEVDIDMKDRIMVRELISQKYKTEAQTLISKFESI